MDVPFGGHGTVSSVDLGDSGDLVVFLADPVASLVGALEADLSACQHLADFVPCHGV